jgi:hypothetical protein
METNTPTESAREAAQSPTPIMAVSLDKDNRKWAENYVATLRERLQREESQEVPDPVWHNYLRHEIASYEDLLNRL